MATAEWLLDGEEKADDGTKFNVVAGLVRRDGDKLNDGVGPPPILE